MLNRQLIFNTVVPLLLAQGGRAMAFRNGDDYCSYRSPDGKKCAVGHLIPDENYTPDLEGCSAQNTDVIDALDPKYGEVGVADLGFLNTMQQNLHDSLYGWTRNNFMNAAEGFARDFGLKVDVNLFK